MRVRGGNRVGLKTGAERVSSVLRILNVGGRITSVLHSVDRERSKRGLWLGSSRKSRCCERGCRGIWR